MKNMLFKTRNATDNYDFTIPVIRWGILTSIQNDRKLPGEPRIVFYVCLYHHIM